MAALEAMAHLVPVIASNIHGLAEIVTPQTGWLVPVGNAAALAAAIAEVDPARLEELGIVARERAEQFTVEKMAQKTETFYRRLHRL